MKETKLFKNWTAQIKTIFPVRDKTAIVANIRHNWLFVFSAMVFFCLNAPLDKGYRVGLLIAFGIAIFVASQFSSLWEKSKNAGFIYHFISVISALGICLATQKSFYATWSIATRLKTLTARFNIDITGLISVLGAIGALYFVYLCVLFFWKHITQTISNTKIVEGISIAEMGIYLFIIIVTMSFMVYSFTQSQAFYGTDFTEDIIFTSDSPSLVKGNVYLRLTHPENDLRQPLFAVFSAPFLSIPYLIAQLVGASSSLQAILINSVQLFMMFFSNFMLAKMMGLESKKRIIFMVLSSCTYTYLLFSLMMEQYIVAFFWLTLCMYLISEKRQLNRIAFWGTSGTLLTGIVLLPFMSNRSPIKEFKIWFMDMIRYGLEFVVLLLAFCRFDVLFCLTSKVSTLIGYTGKTITFADKLAQYTSFVCDCIIAPNANVVTPAYKHASWQLNTAAGINFIGVLILVLAIISFVINRKKISSRLAMGWICFSAIMLLFVGWGTSENGLSLYSLYFGWAFLVLLFQLVEKIGDVLHCKYLLPIISICAVIALLYINIPAIIEMLRFAITYFPV